MTSGMALPLVPVAPAPGRAAHPTAGVPRWQRARWRRTVLRVRSGRPSSVSCSERVVGNFVRDGDPLPLRVLIERGQVAGATSIARGAHAADRPEHLMVHGLV